MGNIRLREDTGNLFFDFRYRGHRCREYTSLSDSGANRRKLKRILDKIEAEIEQGTFEYARYFPNSRNLERLGLVGAAAAAPAAPAVPAPLTRPQPVAAAPQCPSFADFADTWVAENEVRWRQSHRRTQLDIIDGHLKPAFGESPVDRITKPDLLAFRAKLAKAPGRAGDTLSPKRVNSIMAPLRQILDEAADRYEFVSPYRNIKPLKVPRTDVEPFSLEEVQRILRSVRPDFRSYYTVRFFTGMRTGEIDGLKWKYVDFERRLILVRETVVNGREDYTKTDASQRHIQISGLVYAALKEQEQVSKGRSQYVFCTRQGDHLDHNNVTKRVWYPLLRHLGLKPRRPYQTRHTAATLWLAAGENPEWIARQMGHATTEMLFRVYSRYVPNLTRRDGSAFERLLAANIDLEEGKHERQ